MNGADARLRPPTLRDVARHAMVSPMTVSRALRNEAGVAPDKRARILAAVSALGYRGNEHARNLRTGTSSGLVAVVVTNLANPFYSQLALGIESETSEHGMRVIVANSGEDLRRERQLVNEFAARKLDGIIVVPTSNEQEHLDPANLAGMPVVLAASPPSRISVDAVLLDDFNGAWEATRNLIARGHRRIGFLGLPASTWTGSERYRGYCAALEECDIEVDESLVLRRQPDVAAAVAATRTLLDQVDPPTAIFTANNRNTIGAYRATHQLRDQVAIAGFDDFEFADLLGLPVTVVAYDALEFGRQAASLLHDRIANAGGPALEPRRVIIPTSLVEYGGH